MLLDIGAVWCHWCHVMDGESYEDPALAEFLNQHFVCIKVDRDERPDVDARYQHAVQAITRQGGWPLTAFLTPAGEVFYGGTYFPPDGKYGRPGFHTVLAGVLDAYRSRRDQVAAQADAIRRVLDAALDEAPRWSHSALLDGAVRQMASVFDRIPAGSEPAEIPPSGRDYRRCCTGGTTLPTPRSRRIIDRTLEGMGRGGVYDQLRGGFHRYSVDAEWVVPHFEKMSYDNSELLKAYLDAYALFGTEEYAEVARGIVRWVREVMADPEGGYAASQDADVGLDDDGDYFTWTREEAAEALTPEEMAVLGEYYDIGTAGEMHHHPGKNVLFIAASLPDLAGRLERPETEVRALLDSGRAKLLAARERRTAPFVDRTRYANWNAMMASALLRSGDVLGDGWAREHALLDSRAPPPRGGRADALPHTPGGVTGLLEDQVHAAAAALDAYEVTAEAGWLRWAEALMERVWRDYRDEARGGLFDSVPSSRGEGLLPTRLKPIQDTPTPSPNGVAGVVCARLHAFTEDVRWAERRQELVAAFAGGAAALGLHGAAYLLALDWQLNPPTHLVVTGAAGDPTAEAFHRAALAGFAPRRVVRRLLPEPAEAPLPPPLRAMLRSGLRGDGLRLPRPAPAACRLSRSTPGGRRSRRSCRRGIRLGPRPSTREELRGQDRDHRDQQGHHRRRPVRHRDAQHRRQLREARQQRVLRRHPLSPGHRELHDPGRRSALQGAEQPPRRAPGARATRSSARPISTPTSTWPGHCPWRTPARTPAAASSSSATRPSPTSTGCTPCSVRCARAWTWSTASSRTT